MCQEYVCILRPRPWTTYCISTPISLSYQPLNPPLQTDFDFQEGKWVSAPLKVKREDILPASATDAKQWTAQDSNKACIQFTPWCDDIFHTFFFLYGVATQGRIPKWSGLLQKSFSLKSFLLKSFFHMSFLQIGPISSFPPRCDYRFHLRWFWFLERLQYNCARETDNRTDLWSRNTL